MGRADFYAEGDWNARCDRCGRKMKGSMLRETWQGYKVCPEHWEPRHPQDFVRAIPENPTPPFVRNPPDTFIYTCSPNGQTAIVGHATAGCAISGYVHPSFDSQIAIPSE